MKTIHRYIVPLPVYKYPTMQRQFKGKTLNIPLGATKLFISKGEIYAMCPYACVKVGITNYPPGSYSLYLDQKD